MLTRVSAEPAAGPPQGAAAVQVLRRGGGVEAEAAAEGSEIRYRVGDFIAAPEREDLVEAAAVGAVTHIQQAEQQCWQQVQRRIQAGAMAGQKDESFCESKVWR